MLSAVSQRWRRITSACCRLRRRSWPYSDARGLPARSTLSRFLAALDQASVEALRGVFLQDALARPGPAEGVGGLWDRRGQRWVVFDLDGTRQAARQRALPQGPDLPPPQRRLQAVCAPGYTGRKRGEVVRTRTTLLQSHTHQWLGTFGKAGNADYRGELLRGLGLIAAYQAQLGLPRDQALIRLDGKSRQRSHRRGSAGGRDPLADAWQRLRAA
jgi:hypothetical protein